MARPSKLTQGQCDRIRMLKNEGASAPQLAKRFKLSESSIYKILNGSYVAAPGNDLPPAVGTEDLGSTPSLFTKRTAGNKETKQASRVRKAVDSGNQSIDQITLAAAELIVAQANYQRMLNQSR